MKSRRIKVRLDDDLVAALERVAREEAIDQTTTIERLLKSSLREWQMAHAVDAYQRGDVEWGRAAEEAGLTPSQLIDIARRGEIGDPLDVEDGSQRPDGGSPPDEQTLLDIPPTPGGVLLVGINPAPVSVAAGHYYQGTLGERLWRRLQRVGLLRDAVPGAEDEAFIEAGHGFTDLVKRPTTSAKELTPFELAAGAETLRRKIAGWHPGLILFAFKEPARRLLGPSVMPGRGPDLEGIPTFLLSGPYAHREEADRVDRELRDFVGTLELSHDAVALTQRVTERDRERGEIRLPRLAKRFFPTRKGEVQVMLRGQRVTAVYDPRIGPDRERSALLRVGRAVLTSSVAVGERLRVSQRRGGLPILN